MSDFISLHKFKIPGFSFKQYMSKENIPVNHEISWYAN